ncbi:MAG: methionyl-tRNA formyltransferase [Armatimonadota bacterium]|jgi:methionyl-tRNA formyltransferase
MRIAFFGTPPPSVPYLDALALSGHDVVAVVTQPDRPAGRGREVRPSPVKIRAEELGLSVFTPEDASDPRFIDDLAATEPQLGVVVAYGEILVPKLLELPPKGFINVHYSLLPELRGAAPVYAALRRGLDRTGVTIQHMAQKLDAGDVILRREIEIAEDDNRGTLTDRLTDLGVTALMDALEMIADGTAPRVPQDEARASYIGRVHSDDCRLDWSLPADELRDMVRACTPWPGAWCVLDGERMKVQDVHVVQYVLRNEGTPGEIVELPSSGGPVVLCGRDALQLTRLQPAGKKPMSGEEFLRGARLDVGDRFG